MPAIVARTVRGRKYWQIAEIGAAGRTRSVVAHPGRPETLLAGLHQGPPASHIRSIEHGAVAGLWAQAPELVEFIDARVAQDRRGRQRNGLSRGSLVLRRRRRAPVPPQQARGFAI